MILDSQALCYMSYYISVQFDWTYICLSSGVFACKSALFSTGFLPDTSISPAALLPWSCLESDIAIRGMFRWADEGC